MTREEYEERRCALEEQHRADIALLNAAQELRLRALDRRRHHPLPQARLVRLNLQGAGTV